VSGFTLNEIVEAVKAKLETLTDVNVAAHPLDPMGTSIAVLPESGDFIDYFETFGAGGIAKVSLRLRIQSGGEDLPESAYRRLYDLLSVGTGNDRSVMDALYAADANGRTGTLGLTGCGVEFIGVDMAGDQPVADVLIAVHIAKIGATA
jgi:hypothetical protein